jgi:oligosaccharide repeat unit polymerase
MKRRFDLRVYWIFFIFSVTYLALGDVNTPGYFWPISAALFTGGIAFHFSNYEWTSAISIFSLMHIMQFPVAALLTLGLPYSGLAIEPDLWDLTPVSMWAMVWAMVGFIPGIWIAGVFRYSSQNVKMAQSLTWSTPVWLNFLITLSCLPATFVFILSGTYFHSQIDKGFDYGMANSLGFVGYLTYVSYVGSILQFRRFSQTKKSKDLIIACVLTAFLFVVGALSGSRRSGMLVIMISGLYFLDAESVRRKWKKYAFIGGAVFSLLLLPQLEFYRSQKSTGDVLEMVTNFFYYATFQNVFDGNNHSWVTYQAIMARRLGDYVSVGFIIDQMPQRFPFGGYEDVISWPLYLLPTLIRPPTDLSFIYDTYLMINLGFRPNIGGGSSPAMLIGDLFSRGGWTGVVVGMFILGFLLKKLDNYLLSGSFRSTVMWVLLLDSLSFLHVLNCLRIFSLLTRQFLIFYFITILLEAFIKLPRLIKRSKLMTLSVNTH